MKATIRLRIGEHDAHYAGHLVDGAKMLQLFGDVATELCIAVDGDEGLFRAYESVEFLAPVYAGDFIEATGEVVKWGNTSIVIDFVAQKYISPTPREPGTFVSSCDQLREPIIVCKARGTCVTPKSVRRVAAFGRPAPCIITAAIVGAETTREQNPHLPITAEELAAEAARCAAAGATVIHLHAREANGKPSQSAALFGEAIAQIRRVADVIVQTSTGGAVGMSVAERAGPLSLTGKAGPEMATLNVGTINFGDDVFMNSDKDTQEMARRIGAHGAIPEVELYDAGHVDITLELIKKGLLRGPLHVQFVLGIRGALAATENNLRFLVERMGELPAGSTWGVAGVGRFQLPMVELAAKWGGNARVGLEDNVYLAKGVLAEGSAPLVARAAEICAAHGRRVATIEEARKILLGA